MLGVSYVLHSVHAWGLEPVVDSISMAWYPHHLYWREPRFIGTLAFVDDTPLFDGECVRFIGVDGSERVVCGVTTYALRHCFDELPSYGLLPAEAFISAFEKLMVDIHHVARTKYARRDFEPDGPIRVMVHRKDLAP